MTRRLLPLGAALAACVAVAVAAPARANTVPTWDRHFILDTAEGAHFEIDMGRIAEQHAATADGRAVARLMVRDHSGELHALQRLAAGLGVTLPEHPSVLQRHEISDVASHHGTAFDRAYARTEVADHVMDVESADGEAVEGGVAAAKAFAQQYRLVYLRHLAAFRRFAAQVHAS
jgi:putative membrane protein